VTRHTKRSHKQVLQLLILAAVHVIALSKADAASLARQCRKACVDKIAACVTAGNRRSDCRRELIYLCKQQGVAACEITESGATADTHWAQSALLVAPTALTAAASSSSSIHLTWQDTNTRETGYSVERSLAATSGFSQIATLASKTQQYDDNTAAAATTYYYRVRAFGRKGLVSTYSNVANATTPALPDTTPPSTPSGVTASAIDCNQVSVAWNASTDTGG